MGPNKCGVETMFVLFLLLEFACGRLVTEGTPFVAPASDGRRRNSWGSPEADGQGKWPSEGAGIAGRRQQRCETPTAPPRIYRALARRSVGRYVLAASSLIGECARVYAPAPFGTIASSLCARVGNSLDPGGRSRGASMRKGAPHSGLSYERYLPFDGDRVEDEELSGGASVVPPNKYGRVSSSFLVRHALGAVEDSAEDVAFEKATKYELEKAVDDGKHADKTFGERAISRGSARRSPQPSGASVFKTLTRMRKKRATEVGDDLELLADSSHDGDSEVPMIPARGRGRVAGPQTTPVERGASVSPAYSRLDAESRGRLTGSRNLVSGAGDGNLEWVNKLREAASGQSTTGSTSLTGRNGSGRQLGRDSEA